jgi:ELWxxDGT repeat protein
MTRFLGAAMVTTLAAAAAAGGVSRAAEPRLVRDIDPSTASYGSAPRDLIGLGTRAVFHAEDPAHGRELWASDGTPEGSRRIADICPGPCSTRLQGLWTAGGRWFFHADPDLPGSGGPENPDSPPGRGLWSTDGTAAGTQFLGDLDGLRHLASLEAIGVHLFAASTGPHGREPWRTDGTPEGTRRLADLAPGPADSLRGACHGAAALGDHVLFAAETPDRGCELWRSDGSPQSV